MRVNGDLLIDDDLTVTGDVSAGSLDASQLLTGMVPAARIFQAITDRQEGTIADWTVPGLAGKNTYVDWDGTAPVQIHGIAGGVQGQRIVIHNRGGAVMTFAHFSGTATPTNRLVNFAGSGPTPVAGGGSIEYLYFSSGWYIVSHEQGAWVNAPFNAAHYQGFGGNVWTVPGQYGTVYHQKYRLSGRTLTVMHFSNATTLGVTTGHPAIFLDRPAWGNFLVAPGQSQVIGVCAANDVPSAVTKPALFIVDAGQVDKVMIYRDYSRTSNWVSNNGWTTITGVITFEVS
jgi:hypothetical protein